MGAAPSSGGRAPVPPSIPNIAAGRRSPMPRKLPPRSPLSRASSLLDLETSFSSRITPAASMLLVPVPSSMENFDDGSMEEPEHPEIKENPAKELAPFLQEPISSGSPTRSSDVSGEHDMCSHAVPPPRPEIPFWSTAAYEELIYAKKEIVNAPLVSGDPDLYAPLFWNVSIFKKSYELMERLLKVFIYHDGAKPIFHSLELKGIYVTVDGL